MEANCFFTQIQGDNTLALNYSENIIKKQNDVACAATNIIYCK